MKLNCKKLKYNMLLLLIFILSIIGFIIFSKSFGMYVASGESEVNVDLAFSLLQTDELEKEIELEEIKPDSSEHTYSFSVANYDGDKLIDINMEYVIKITATTNVPISYVLYDWEGNEIEATGEYVEDEYGTIFYVITSNTYEMNYTDKKIDRFKIKYYLDSQYDSSIYQNIIELLSVKVEAKQV